MCNSCWGNRACRPRSNSGWASRWCRACRACCDRRAARGSRLAFRPLTDAPLESRTLELKRSGDAEPVALRFAEYLRKSIEALPARAED
ncbi:protein of unknown function [Burkholderia multivorans]